jgi:hypothetical protein
MVQIATRSLVLAYELFAQNRQLPTKCDEVRSRASEAHFWLFLATIENALDLESLSSDFHFVEPRRRVGEFVSRHPYVEVVRLQSAIMDLQRRLVRQDRERCQLG